MKIKLIHPLWTHLPAVIALIIMVVYAFVPSLLPSNAPVHYGNNGIPNAYGSPWWALSMITGLSIFFILLSGFLDELWARQEKTKAFNWLSLMDDITVGAMAGINIGYFTVVRQEGSLFSFPWVLLGLMGGGATILGILLEMVRPYRPYPIKLVEVESQALKTEIDHRLKGDSPLVYWDYQNPPYISVLTIIIPLIMLGSGILTWFSQPALSILLFVVAILMVTPYGGLRVLVTRHDVTIRFGILGFRVLRLKMKDIVGIEKHEFAPIRDFGGYGIRFNREMKAYYMRGNSGVKITTSDGKKYLIGSDNVDRLATIISAVSSRR
jgi:hypothetical protein